MLRTRRLIAFLCIAAVVMAVLAPAGSNHFATVLTTLWLFAPSAAAVPIRLRPVPSAVQPGSLVSLDASRAPPALLA